MHMETQSFFNDYTKKMCQIEEIILDFIDSFNNQDETFDNLIDFLNDQKILENIYQIQEILQIVIKISKNYHRMPKFFDKIDRILKLFQAQIKNLSNFSIFNIFKSSKRILLYMFEEKILIPDKYIFNIIKKGKYKERNYPEYFYPEFKSFTNEIKHEIDIEEFKQKRKIGENDSYVCELIRTDSINDFIVFSTKMNLNLSSTIDNSIYETNSALLKNKNITLIEYAAFYGSINIFKYLFLNKVQLKSSLLKYAIHGNNAELIHFLEEKNTESENKLYEICFKESIKTYNNDFTNYFKNKLSEYELDKEMHSLMHYLCFYSFVNMANSEYSNANIETPIIFYLLCKYNYITVVDFLLKNKKVNNNTKITVYLMLFNGEILYIIILMKLVFIILFYSISCSC